MSILQAIAQNPSFDSLYFQDASGRWHCWLADSSFDASTLDACKAGLLSARGRLFAWQPDTIVFTLGTTHFYEHARMVVGNCHKQPQTMFNEVEATLEQVITTLDAICQLFPRAQVVFTVSPYRYAKYGMHESQLSKARLLLAIEEVRRTRPAQVTYFPAYEIVLDELRDYRFYGTDMLHPSPVAVDYIWERFVAQWLDDEARRYLLDYEPIRKALAHRPFEPDSKEAIHFREQTQERLNALMAKYNIEP